VGLGLVFLVGCGSSLSGNPRPTQDSGPTCASSGESCATIGCCGELSDACLPVGNDKVCVNAILSAPDGGDCILGLTSDLRGVALTFDGAPCSYSQAELAAGIGIPYHEEIDSTIEGVHPADADGGDFCQQPDAAGLIVNYDIAGGGQQYCECNTVLCSTGFTTSAVPGNYFHQIPWDGRNWSGPTTTGGAEGAPFPVGTYTITLTAKGGIDGVAGGPGPHNYTLTAMRTITITP
jgi:hypothetical protein